MDILTSLFWCILGIAGGAIFTIVNNKRKRLTRKMFTVNLISEKVSTINGLEIKYNSHPIKNLYSSTIQIKNTGNATINNIDIPKKRPLSIYTDGIFIIDKLNMQLPNPNNENDIHVSFNKTEKGTSSSAIIDFEFISPRQLITITLLHTGTISLGKWMIKDGKVLESNEILDENDAQIHSFFSKHSLLYILAIIISLIIIPCLSVFFFSTTKLNDLKFENYNMQDHIKELENNNNRMEEDIYDLTDQIYNLKSELEILRKQLILDSYSIIDSSLDIHTP